MSTFPTPDRPPLAGYQTTPQYSRPLPGPTATPTAPVDSPDRYAKPAPLQQVASNPLPQSPYQSTESSSTYAQPSAQPQPPITPLSGNHYPSQPPPSSGSGSYFGVAQTPTDQAIPSPPPTSTSRPGSSNANYTPEGVPIVPVGISGGKMFRCVGYGDCSKVFTRSEHLARHIRKHTGERPFPCHCSKAFSRLDNLRQHAATVHADQAELNEQMLQSLASVHAALSQRANREQRARGEVVEVPKNAIERRHVDTSRRVSPRQMGAAYDAYGHTGPVATDWHIAPPQPGRPRTGGGYEYYQNPGEGHPVPPGMDAGPSRRPSTSAGAYSGYPAPMYYDQSMRPPASAQALAGPQEMSQLPYPYRPMSSNGRELPIPVHYAGSEPPPSAHSAHSHPPQSPMYPHGTTGPQLGQWTSPPHSAYPPQADPYHVQPGQSHESFSYPNEPGPHGHGYAPPPPPSPYGYTAPTAYYPPQQYGQAPGPYAPPQGPYPPPPGYTHPPHAHMSLPPLANPAHPGPPGPVQAAPAANPPESPFSYSAPQPQEYSYGSTYYDPRKRRVEDEVGPRKVARTDGMPAVAAASESLTDATDRNDPTWFPPTTERRSSLAISALLGSPQQVPRSRPSTAEVATQSNFEASYTFPPDKSNLGVQGTSLPATPQVNGTRRLQDEVKTEPVASAMA